jgi:hypothetical protein
LSQTPFSSSSSYLLDSNPRVSKLTFGLKLPPNRSPVAFFVLLFSLCRTCPFAYPFSFGKGHLGDSCGWLSNVILVCGRTFIFTFCSNPSFAEANSLGISVVVASNLIDFRRLPRSTQRVSIWLKTFALQPTKFGTNRRSPICFCSRRCLVSLDYGARSIRHTDRRVRRAREREQRKGFECRSDKRDQLIATNCLPFSCI